MPRSTFSLPRLVAALGLAIGSPAAAQSEPLLVMFYCDAEDVAAMAEIVAFEVGEDERVRALSHPQAQLVETPRTVTLVEPDGRVIHIEGDDSFMSKGGVVHALACRDATEQLDPVARRLSEARVAAAETEVARLRVSQAEALARIEVLERDADQRQDHEGW